MNEQRNAKGPNNDALDNVRETYNAFDRFVTIREEDSTPVMIGKLFLRLIG